MKDIIQKIAQKEGKNSQWQKLREGGVTVYSFKEGTDKSLESFNIINPSICKTITKKYLEKQNGLKQKQENYNTSVLLMSHQLVKTILRNSGMNIKK